MSLYPDLTWVILVTVAAIYGRQTCLQSLNRRSARSNSIDDKWSCRCLFHTSSGEGLQRQDSLISQRLVLTYGVLRTLAIVACESDTRHVQMAQLYHCRRRSLHNDMDCGELCPMLRCRLN